MSRVLEEVTDAQLVRFTALNLYNPQVYNLIHKSLPLIRMMNHVGQITKCMYYVTYTKSNENFKTTIPSKNYDRPKNN